MATGFSAGVTKNEIVSADKMNSILRVLLNVDGTVPMTGHLNCGTSSGVINIHKLNLASNMFGTSLPNAGDGELGDVFFLLET
jgi:hypothetical protein